MSALISFGSCCPEGRKKKKIHSENATCFGERSAVVLSMCDLVITLKLAKALVWSGLSYHNPA